VKSTSISNGDLSMQIRKFSPDGNLLAVSGKQGYIYLLDWRVSGGEQVIASLKSNSPINSLTWSPSGSYIYSLGRESEVVVWDVSHRQCVNKWSDEGGYGSRHLCLDSHSSYLSIG